MIPVTQTKVVVKNSNGEMIVRGNCYAACIASIIELPISEVPNVEVLFHIEGGFWSEVMHAFLTSKGWELSTNDRFRCFHPETVPPKYDNDVELTDDVINLKDKYYLVSGMSKRGVMHMCIYQNGKLVHDPHPTNEGIETCEYFEEITKTTPHAH